MDDAERRAIEWDCAQNTKRFYNRLDAVQGEEAAELFAEDGIWYKLNSNDGFVGRTEIAAYVNSVRARGFAEAPEADRVVFHLACNLEVNVIDADNAEVRAATVVIPGSSGASEGGGGWTRGISIVSRTVEMHKRTAEGWKIASKRTLPAMKMRRGD
ncbi:MAG: nuclear transport factor 2 family protein [Blastomonas sp.]